MNKQTKTWEEELARYLQEITAKYDKWQYAMYLYSPIKSFIHQLLKQQKEEFKKM